MVEVGITNRGGIEMIYEIILTNGNVLTCFTKDYNEVLRMIIDHSIYIVRENEHPNKATYIEPEKVSHYRFPLDSSGVARPV